MLPDALISFAAGILSFLSPCVLPLIPSYLTFIGGASLGDLASGSPAGAPVVRRRVIIRTVAFCAGFAAVFIILGIAFSSASAVLSSLGAVVDVVAGCLVILLGLNVIFDFWKLLQADRRFHLTARPRGIAGAFLAGVAFSAGWSPCVGPILASILFLAGSEDGIWRAAAHLGLYSLGLALPFLAMALFFSALNGVFAWLKKRLGLIRIISGVFLILVGALIALGKFRFLNGLFASGALALSSFAESSPLLARVLFAAVYALAALAFLAVPPIRKRSRSRRSSGTESGKTVNTIALAARIAAITGLLILAVLESAGIISTAVGIGAWLGFQGI